MSKTSIITDSALHIVGLHTFTVHETFECSPNHLPPPFALPWHCKALIENMFYSGPHLIRNVLILCLFFLCFALLTFHHAFLHGS